MKRGEKHEFESDGANGAKSRRAILWPLAYVLLVVVTAAVATAWGGGGGHGRHGFGGGPHGPKDPEQMREHMAFAIEFGLRKLDATEEQQTRIQAIASETLDEMIALHEQHAASKRTLRELLSAQELDREAIEAWRSGQLAAVDAASQQLATAAVDALEVLSPEQRGELAEHLDRRYGRHGH
jgi:Spy/CpxP family protein refolding chaperone